MSIGFQAARHFEFFKGRSKSGPNTDALADALAIAQHHDAVSGTERQHVAADYALRISRGYLEVHFNYFCLNFNIINLTDIKFLICRRSSWFHLLLVFW